MDGDKLGGEHWEHTQIEHEKQRHPYTTYKAINVVVKEYNLYYSVCLNPAKTFPYGPGRRPVALKQLQARLDTLLLFMKDCKGQACVKPWQALHPKGDVQSLTDGLRQEFDNFYWMEQKEVAFEECTLTYEPRFEGPTDFERYKETGATRVMEGSRALWEL
ncbi:MAG: hypothetical protein Q9205_006936 [Flavoplaca limonia]